MLTIVIPFYNEDWRVEFTVKSVRDTTVTNPKIILINDGSKDKYDYKAVADKYNCKYVEHDGK
jgi:glycosyltransferase involved in cell wall biosynthesis